eukprot:1367939-Amorphochlora_amoeboformis.AAC.1
MVGYNRSNVARLDGFDLHDSMNSPIQPRALTKATDVKCCIQAEEERLAAEAEVRRLEEQKVKMEELRKELAEKAKAEAKEEVERLKGIAGTVLGMIYHRVRWEDGVEGSPYS